MEKKDFAIVNLETKKEIYIIYKFKIVKFHPYIHFI